MKRQVATLDERLEIQRLAMILSNAEIAERLNIPLRVVKYVKIRFPPPVRRKLSKVICPQLIDAVRDMMEQYSNNEIAARLEISVATVRRVLSNYNLSRTREQESTIRSRLRKELIIAERRRVLFGREQKTNIKVFTNRERNVLRSNLRRCGYIVIRNDMTVYYNSSTRRNETFEERGKKVGLSFAPLTD